MHHLPWHHDELISFRASHWRSLSSMTLGSMPWNRIETLFDSMEASTFRAIDKALINANREGEIP